MKYFRTLRMVKNANRLGLQAIIVGDMHARHLNKKRFDVLHLRELDLVNGTALQQKEAYKKYASVIRKMYRDMKSGGLKFK